MPRAPDKHVTLYGALNKVSAIYKNTLTQNQHPSGEEIQKHLIIFLEDGVTKY